MKKFTSIFILCIGLGLSSFTTITPFTGPDPVLKVLKFYPNPASAVINFEFLRNFDKTHSLQFYNFMGKKVFESNNLSARFSIQLGSFSRGVYIYQLRDKYGKIVDSGKFQIVK